MGITNTMLMAIFERTQEIGTLMAMGLRKKKLLMLFTFESIFLGIFGSLTGCILGGSITYYYKIVGLNLADFDMSGFDNMPLASVIYTDINMTILIFAFLFGVAVSIISALYPAYRGSKLEPKG